MTRYLSVLMLLVAGQNVVGQAADECAFSEPEKLTASDGNPYDYFGESVSISGETMVIGARGRDLPDPGGAYIFERDGLGNWNEVQKLTASDGGEWHEFGRSVSISGDYVLIGAPRDYDNGEDSGSAYVFERDRDGNWNEVQKLTASDGAAEDYFGWSVSISGDDAVIGALGDDDNGGPGGQVGAGGAYIFERDGDGNWNEVQKLTASDGAGGDWFGSSVSISGDYAVIGADRDDDNGFQSGSAYIFERDGAGNWSEVQKLTAFDGAANDEFGSSVSNSGDYAVIGAYGDDDNGPYSGSAYVFERDGAGNWSERAKLIASDGNPFDYFGISVSISGDYAVIGASVPWYNSSSGSAYVFERDRAGNWSEAQKVTASDGAELDSFGYSVSISGETMVIGAYGDDDNGSGSGSAYAFKLGLEDKLTASDGAEGDWFGRSVSISGDYAVIGADRDDDNGADSGSAYVFERDGAGNWLEVQKLTASDGNPYDNFGSSVSISGDYAVIGARYDDDNGSSSGSAYVFERDGSGNWSEVQKLTASDGAGGDWFGYSVSISGDYAVVGAYYDDDNGSASGSAYVFERDGAGNWSERAKLTASDGAASDSFGISVSISGEYAMIGAVYDEDKGFNSGSAYVFERDGSGNWSEVQKLTASDGAGNDRFGVSVSISGDDAVIGAPSDDDNGSASGSAYVFERDGAGNWSERAKLTASDGAASDSFGSSVSISGDYAMIGANGDDDNGSKTGSAYVFERDEFGNWSETGKLTACDGAGGDLFGSSVSISGDDALIGAPLDYDNGSSSGSAYVYKIQPGPVCLGDTNGDLIVNLVDFTQLMVDYGTTGESAADFNGDNIVDLADFSILLVNYGNSCNAPLRAAPAGGSRSLAGSKAIGSSTR